jgi:hypothetical protein
VRRFFPVEGGSRNDRDPRHFSRALRTLRLRRRGAHARPRHWPEAALVALMLVVVPFGASVLLLAVAHA